MMHLCRQAVPNQVHRLQLEGLTPHCNSEHLRHQRAGQTASARGRGVGLGAATNLRLSKNKQLAAEGVNQEGNERQD